MPSSKNNCEQNLYDFFCAKKSITALELVVKYLFMLHYSHAAAKILVHFKSLAPAPPSVSFQDGLADTYAQA